ncbi:MAG: Uncharacterised protein [Bacteroidetes bacterium MED-G17]|nr:MAG: Uncharacterised protein [Bacteroidetes bacterium MED-G17]
MRFLSILLAFIQKSSFLVFLGIPATCYALCLHYQIAMPYPIYWLIGSSAWLVYLLDHFIDAGTSTLSVDRYDFIAKRKKIFAGIGAAIVLLNAFLVFVYFDKTLLIFGMVIGLLVLVHQFINTSVRKAGGNALFKESFVALMVTLVFGFPVLYNFSVFQGHLVPLFFLLLINLGNVWLFAHIEIEEDRKNNYPSLALSLGKKKSKQMLKQLYFLLLIGLAGQWNFEQDKALLIALAAMVITLQVILLKTDYFSKNNLYRFWGDLIYLYPLMALLIQNKLA